MSNSLHDFVSNKHLNETIVEKTFFLTHEEHPFSILDLLFIRKAKKYKI